MHQNNLSEGEILELRDYWLALRRHWVSVCAFSLMGLLVGATFSLLVKPVYTSHTQLFVAIQSSGTVSELQQGNSFSTARVQSYVRTVTTPVVLQPVIDQLGLGTTPASLAEQIEAGAEPNTVLISISASDESPVLAAAIAQAVSESLVTAVNGLEGDSPVKLSVVTPAVAPAEASFPNTPLNLLVGLVLGAAVGVGYSLLRSATDTKIRGESDLERISTSPILGGITFDQDAAKRPLLTQSAPQSPRAESFRQIRTNLQFANIRNESKTILVTSSLAGEGKSTTATNMAIALAQDGKRVVLVDADLRRPSVATYLGLEGSAGLTTALIGSADVQGLLQPWGTDALYVLTSGQIPPNPSELLGSEAMRELLLKLEAEFDAIVIDVPPLIPVTDAAVLARYVGGVVLVVGAGKAKSPDVQKSLNSLKLVDSSVLGIVVNLLPPKGPDAYAYSYYSYDAAQGSRKRSSERKRR